MADEKNPKESQEAAAGRSPGEVPLDTRVLADAIIELNISRKNVGIYPPGHIQISKSVDRVFDTLKRLFEIRPEMTLGVAQDTLLVGRDYLDKTNPVYRDFALSLSQLGIATVTFAAGLTKEELVRFHGILTTKPEETRSLGGIEKMMSDASIEHVRIVGIDYRSFHVTEEQEITQPHTTANRSSGSDIWQDFVSLLSEGNLAATGEGVSLRDAEQIEPAELARLLNEHKMDAAAAVESYDRIISDYIRGAAEQKQMTREQTDSAFRLNNLLKDLHPDLRKQFLSVAFQRISAAPPGTVSEEIIGGMTDNMVIEMLGQASEEGREISPTLTGLIGKLSGTGPAARTGRAPAAAVHQQSGFGVPEVPPEQMQKLFDRERYEEYVPREYEAMLRQMTASSSAVDDPFPLEEELKTLEDGNLDFQIGRALLAFLEEDLSEEDYREFAGKLAAVAPGFLETGNFELLFDISESLRRHALEKPVEGIRAAAGEARRIFSEPSFIEKAVHSFEVWMREKGQEASGLIRSLGPDTVPGLMDIFSRDRAPGAKGSCSTSCVFSGTRPSMRPIRD
jgi:hypothetical protein